VLKIIQCVDNGSPLSIDDIIAWEELPALSYATWTPYM
jgi:hypothetical protein